MLAILGEFCPFFGLYRVLILVSFCPEHICTCTSTGPLNLPPAKKSGIKANTDDGTLDYGLCQFACERDYCPQPCTSSNSTSASPGGVFFPGDGGNDPQYGGFGWPLLTVESSYTSVHMGDALSDVIENIFQTSTCPIKTKRALHVAPRDAVTDSTLR